MSPRRLVAAVLLLAAVVLAALALLRLVDNPDVPAEAWDHDGTRQCLAPWDTVTNGADNVPGGEPPPDAEVIATRCRHAGYARFDDAYLAGTGALAALVGATAVALTRRRGAAVSILATTLAITVAAGLGWGGWERRHPTAFDDNANAQSFDTLPAGKAVYFGVNWPGNPGSDVVIETARPLLTRDTANGSVEIVVCVPRPGADPLGNVFAYRIDHFCSALVPIRWDEPEVRLDSGRKDQLLIQLTTHAPGTVDVAGVELVYRNGWRRGRQEVAARATVTTLQDR